MTEDYFCSILGNNDREDSIYIEGYGWIKMKNGWKPNQELDIVLQSWFRRRSPIPNYEIDDSFQYNLSEIDVSTIEAKIERTIDDLWGSTLSKIFYETSFSFEEKEKKAIRKLIRDTNFDQIESSLQCTSEFSTNLDLFVNLRNCGRILVKSERYKMAVTFLKKAVYIIESNQGIADAEPLVFLTNFLRVDLDHANNLTLKESKIEALKKYVSNIAKLYFLGDIYTGTQLLRERPSFYKKGYPFVIEAFTVMLLSARLGDEEYYFPVGYAYFYEHGTKYNLYAAYQWFLRTSKRGLSISIIDYYLSWCYSSNYVLVKKLNLADFMTQVTSPLFDPKFRKLQFFFEENKYLFCLILESKIRESLEPIKQLAIENYVPAQTDLGYKYESGYGIRQDFKEALKWFNRSIEAKVIRSNVKMVLRVRNELGLASANDLGQDAYDYIDERLSLASDHVGNLEYNKAIILLSQLLEKFPDNFEVTCYLGRVYSLAGDDQLAISFLEKAISIEEDDQKCLSYYHSFISLNLTKTWLSCAYDSLGETERALSIEQQLISLHSPDPSIMGDVCLLDFHLNGILAAIELSKIYFNAIHNALILGENVKNIYELDRQLAFVYLYELDQQCVPDQMDANAKALPRDSYEQLDKFREYCSASVNHLRQIPESEFGEDDKNAFDKHLPAFASEIGWFFLVGDGTEQYMAYYKKGYEYSAQAFQAFLLAAELGDVAGYRLLAHAYRNGFGIEKNLDKAFEYDCKAFEVDPDYSVNSQNLAWRYYYGIGVSKNDKKSFELMSKLAEDNYSHAQFRLGEMYEEGLGVEINLNKALEWFEKSIYAEKTQIRIAAIFRVRVKLGMEEFPTLDKVATNELQRLINKVNDFCEKSKITQAISTSRKILSRDIDNFEILALLGYLYQLTGDHKMAITTLKKAISLVERKSKPLSYYNSDVPLDRIKSWLNFSLGRVGEYEKALSICEEILSLHSPDPLEMGNACLFDFHVNGLSSAVNRSKLYSKAIVDGIARGDKVERVHDFDSQLAKIYLEQLRDSRVPYKHNPKYRNLPVDSVERLDNFLEWAYACFDHLRKIPEQELDEEDKKILEKELPDFADQISWGFIIGDGTEQQPAYYQNNYAYAHQAFEAFLLCAELGVIDSYRLLSQAYWTGTGTKQNYNMSFKYAKKAYEKDTETLQNSSNLAWHYYYGLGTNKDYHKALELIKEPLDQEEQVALRLMALMYEEGKCVICDLQKAKELLKKRIEKYNENNPGLEADLERIKNKLDAKKVLVEEADNG
jgi:TPR repeat protein